MNAKTELDALRELHVADARLLESNERLHAALRKVIDAQRTVLALQAAENTLLRARLAAKEGPK